MNRKMIFFARAGKWGGFGASGLRRAVEGSANKRSLSKEASAIDPRPTPPLPKKSRAGTESIRGIKHGQGRVRSGAADVGVKTAPIAIGALARSPCAADLAKRHDSVRLVRENRRSAQLFGEKSAGR